MRWMYFDYFFSSLQVVYDANTLYVFAPSAQSRDQWVRNLKEGNGNCLYLTFVIGRYLCLSCLPGLELAWCCVLDLWPKQCWKQRQCCRCCWAVLAQHWGFAFFLLCPHSEEIGGGQEAERRHRDIPGHIKLCSAIKTGVEEDRVKGFLLCYWLLLRDWLGIFLLVGDGDWFTLLYFWVVFFSLLVIKLSLSQVKFLISCSFYSFPHPTVLVEWVNACMGA